MNDTAEGMTQLIKGTPRGKLDSCTIDRFQETPVLESQAERKVKD